jgi:uncharacterized phage protein (TIGR02218 family)
MVTYQGRPIFPFPVEWSEAPKVSLDFDSRADVVGFGAEVMEPQQEFAALSWEASVFLDSACAINRFERFVAACDGRRLGFWILGPMQELEIVAQHDADEIDVVACGFTAAWQDSWARHFWLRNEDTGSGEPLKVVGVLDNGNGTERIRASASLASAPDARWTLQRLYFVRFASDAQEQQYVAPWQAEVRVAVVELPLEYLEALIGDRPVYLYEFAESAVGTDTTYRFTSSDVDVEWGGFTWTARPFSHGELRSAVQGDSDTLMVESWRFTGNPLNSYFPFPPQRSLRVTVREWRQGLTAATVLFAGQLKTADLQGRRIRATCETLLADAERRGPHFRVQSKCQYVFGDALTCRYNLAAAKHTGTVTAISGKSITVSGLSGAANYWANGHVKTVNTEGQAEVRTIIGSAAGVVVIANRFDRVAVGAAIDVYPGCDLTAATCVLKGNMVNFGGHPKINRNLSLKAIETKTAAGGKK